MASGIHDGAADGGDATKIDVQLIRIHQTSQIATEDLTQHAQQHQAAWTQTGVRESLDIYLALRAANLLLQRLICQQSSEECTQSMKGLCECYEHTT